MDNFSLFDIANKQPVPTLWQRFKRWLQRLADKVMP